MPTTKSAVNRYTTDALAWRLRLMSTLTGTAARNAAGSVTPTAAAYKVNGARSQESWLRHRGRPTLAGGGRFQLLVNSLATGAWRSALV
jgi:hypothetical protein